jgi:exopolyphosphatase / guanosine-5'-triphosphate,3'-diphosphate pyrophosphatase
MVGSHAAEEETPSHMAQPPKELTLAAIDIGSNTVHLAVSTVGADGALRTSLADEVEMVRLGADVTATGSIGEERASRACAAVTHQIAVARGAGAATILGVATEGVRRASNGQAFIERVRAETGLQLELITGDQEAALTYWGARPGDASSAKAAVLDLGGGSLEVVVGAGRQVLWRVSLPLGSGALHDELAPSDPASAAELLQVGAVVREALAEQTPPLPVASVTVCGGTATTLAALARRALGATSPANGAEPRSPGALSDLTHERIASLLGLLHRQTAAEVNSRYGVEIGRARLLATGAVILDAALARLRAPALQVSRTGIREGAMLAYAQVGARWLDAATRGK